jgi:aurora kinase
MEEQPRRNSYTLGAGLRRGDVFDDDFGLDDEEEGMELGLPHYTCLSQFINRLELCRGVASTIYLATCATTRAKVVLKVYAKRRLSARQKNELARELALLKRLAGPFVVRLLGSFETDKEARRAAMHSAHRWPPLRALAAVARVHPPPHVLTGAAIRIFALPSTSQVVLVLEHCAGGDLFKAMIVRGQVADEQWACVEVVTPLLRLLEKMHRLNVSHRDIKPENIFLTARGALRLGDFGLAIDNSRELAFAHVGTLDYMAPEVLRNGKVRIIESPSVTLDELTARNLAPYGPAVDVWAVGVLAYELVTGRPPFECDDEREEAKLIMNSNRIRFPPGKSAAWVDFVQRALTKEPRLRPTAAELLEHPFITGGIYRALRGGPLQRKPSAELLLRPLPLNGTAPPLGFAVLMPTVARAVAHPMRAMSVDSNVRGLGLPRNASTGTLGVGGGGGSGSVMPLGRSRLGAERFSPGASCDLRSFNSGMSSGGVASLRISEVSESDSDDDASSSKREGSGSLLSNAIASLLSGVGLSRRSTPLVPPVLVTAQSELLSSSAPTGRAGARIPAPAGAGASGKSSMEAEAAVAGSSPPLNPSYSRLRNVLGIPSRSSGGSSFDSAPSSGARKPGARSRRRCLPPTACRLVAAAAATAHAR